MSRFLRRCSTCGEHLPLRGQAIRHQRCPSEDRIVAEVAEALEGDRRVIVGRTLARLITPDRGTYVCLSVELYAELKPDEIVYIDDVGSVQIERITWSASGLDPGRSSRSASLTFQYGSSAQTRPNSLIPPGAFIRRMS